MAQRCPWLAWREEKRLIQPKKGPVELERAAAVWMPQGLSSELAGPSLVVVRQLQAEKQENRVYV